MLFVLSGDIQTGKTRWLCDVCDEVERMGVVPFGVLAPGVWREPARGNDVVRVSGGFSCGEVAAIDWDAMPAAPVDANGFEKMGICNVLMPERETLLFALRRDVAVASGRLRAGSQSEKAQMGWHISDEAIARVDEHFARALATGTLAAALDCQNGRRAHFSAPAQVQRDEDGASSEKEQLGSSNRAAVDSEGNQPRTALLVVDELGRLELLRGGGLASAMALLDAGPTPECPHAIVVARAGLAPYAEHRFADRWNGSLYIYPDGNARAALLGAVRHAADCPGPAHAW